MLKFHCSYEMLVPADDNDPPEEAIRAPFLSFRAMVGLDIVSVPIVASSAGLVSSIGTNVL
jgi:hypothetical protein